MYYSTRRRRLTTPAENTLIVIIWNVLVILVAGPASADEYFNAYIQKSVSYVEKQRSNRKFDGPQQKYYTQNLDYADQKSSIRTNNRPGEGKTMCVAAVTETIIEALNLYWGEPSISPAEQEARRVQLLKMPAKSWGRYPDETKKLDIRPYLFTMTWCSIAGRKYAESLPPGADGNRIECDPKKKEFSNFGVDLSHGTGEALVRFGMGKAVPVEDLSPGDFINFNRNGKDRQGNMRNGGHATIFQGWIVKSGERIGFKYFSAQGATNGFGHMNAYFTGNCPSDPNDRSNDCGIDKGTLVTGRMLTPDRWQIEKALPEIKLWLKKNDLLWPWQEKEIDDQKFISAVRKDPLGLSVDMKSLSAEIPGIVGHGAQSIEQLQTTIDAVFNEPMKDFPNPAYGRSLIDEQ